jgi:hypothetical protein
MKYKFILENVETGIKQKHRTLQEIAEVLKVDYHQARSVLLSEDKQFLHPKIKDLCKQYKICKNVD